MRRFEMCSMIDCDLQALYDFHLDVGNLKAITPPDTRVTLLNEEFVPFEGAILILRTVKYFMPTVWEVKIEKMTPPNLLVDVALRSPFKSWEHAHVFTQKGGQCELKDVVNYELPFGALGSLFDVFIRRELTNMFRYRHAQTQRLLGTKQ